MISWKGIKFNKTEAEQMKEDNFTSLNVNLSLLKVSKVKNDLRLDFKYMAEFEPGIAKLALYGYVMLSGEKKELDELTDKWVKKKMIVKEISEPLANLITYSSEINGVLVARALNMPAPVIPPKITLEGNKK